MWSLSWVLANGPLNPSPRRDTFRRFWFEARNLVY